MPCLSPEAKNWNMNPAELTPTLFVIADDLDFSVFVMDNIQESIIIFLYYKLVLCLKFMGTTIRRLVLIHTHKNTKPDMVEEEKYKERKKGLNV